MKQIIRSVMVAAVMALVATAHGFSLPIVGTETEPNKWSRNMSGVLAAAQKTGYPIFLVMINDSSSGEGCGHCKAFVENTLNRSEFDAIVKDYKFYMVLLNYWGNENGVSQPKYGGVSAAVFNTYFKIYQADGGFPAVAVIRPSGTTYKKWGHKTSPSTRTTKMNEAIRQAIADLAPKNDTKFDLAAESGNTVVVQTDNAGAPQPGTWKGVITRSGESGVTGSVAISLTGSNAAKYSLSATSLAWDANDGSKSFTVTGPSSSDGGLVTDTITVSIQASGFDGTKVSYGTSSQTITFKDGRVKQSLAEFAAANTGLQGLASGGGTWFVPSQNDGNVLETIVSADSALVFTATAGGILTVGVGRSGDGVLSAAAAGETVTLVSGEPERFGVAAGQKITFSVSPNAGEGNTVGFTEFSFKPLSVSLSKPANKASISYGEMMGDKSLVDLGWSANMKGCTFSLTCDGVTKDMGTATSGNAIDLGFVSDSPETKSYAWSVRASLSEDELHGTAVGTASATFEVVASPSFELPATVTAYKSVSAKIDLSVASAAGGDVTYSIDPLPDGMEFNEKTGELKGSPRASKTYELTVTAKSAYGEKSAKVSLAVSALSTKYTRTSYVCLRFGGTDNVEASMEVKIRSNGKWKAKLDEGGRTTVLNGYMTSRADGTLALASGSRLNLAFNPATGIWSGSSNGHRVYGRAAEKATATWKGTWNSGVGTSASATIGGWVCAKVLNSGQVSFSGSIAGQRVSGKGRSVVFPASFVAANLPRWAGHGNVRFAHMGKVKGGYALCSNGTLGGQFTIGSVAFDLIEGSKWGGGSLAALNGATFKTAGGGNVSIPVAATGSKLSAKENSYKAKISATKKSGRMRASYTKGGKVKATGVIYRANGTLKAAGGGIVGSSPFTFVIE